jgi:hypothetical protein
MTFAPGHAHLPAIKILHRDNFLAPSHSLYRDTAPVSATKFVTGDKFAAPIKIVPRSRQYAINFVP